MHRWRQGTGRPGDGSLPTRRRPDEEDRGRPECRPRDAGAGGTRHRRHGFRGAPGEAGADQGGMDLCRPAQRRRLVGGARPGSALRPEEARQERDHDLQGERARRAAGIAGHRQPRARRQQDHLRHLVRLHGRDGGSREEVPGRLLRARDGVQERQELCQLLRRCRRRDLPVGHGRGRSQQERARRLRRPVPDPGDHQASERFCAGCSGDASRGEDQDRVDEVVVRPRQGEEGGREPRRRRRRCDRAERRQPGRRPVRAVERHSVGRARLVCPEVRAHVMADGRPLQLGPLLPQARQGGPERHLEDRELLGLDGRRVHTDRAVRAQGVVEDEGDDRLEEEPRSSPASSTSSRAPSTTRVASCAFPRGRE